MASLRSQRVATPEGIRPATIHYRDGVITLVDDGVADDDYGELVILPGLVDTHVHVNEPGRSDWEGFETATRAAAAGGVTTLVDMPLNSKPPTVTPAALSVKRSAALNSVHVDVGFWGGIVPGSSVHMEPLAAEGVCGFKAFMVDSGVPEFPPVDTATLTRAARLLQALGAPLLVHAEDQRWLTEIRGDPRRYESYLSSRPPVSESRAVEVVADIARETSAAIHVLHVSSAEAVAAIASGPAGLSGETCPHYLYFDAAEIPAGATEFKCAPPIRGREHREELWSALIDGRITMVVSDHSPSPPDVKAMDTGDFSRSWGGISSLQLRLPVVWKGASDRGIGLEMLAGWLAAGPAALAGLQRKGAIEPGKDADFAVFDPEPVWTVDATSLEHRHPVTPYNGMDVQGRVLATILRGRSVYEQEGIDGEFRGELVRRHD